MTNECKIDSELWKVELQQKSALEKYFIWKNNIKEEEKSYGIMDSITIRCYLFRAGTNTLDLQWRKRSIGEGITCKLCQEVKERFSIFS